MKSITIESRKIGQDYPPFIVAEISANHHQSLDQALLLVEAAKHARVDAIKLQTYTADTMTLNLNKQDFLISDPESLWYKRNLYELYQEAYTPWEWHSTIFQRCKELDLIAFSTPFDLTAVQFLEELDVPCYKIASLEIRDHALIQATAATGKPLMISTGGAILEEIEEAVQTARNAGCKELILLKCPCAYPANPESVNLRTLPHLADTFDTLVGLSDHTPGISVAIASVAFGATVLEKHFTLSRASGGVDAAFSLEPQEIAELVVESKNAWKALGKVHYGPTPEEAATLKLRRSLYFVKSLKSGERVTADHIRAIRPGYGLAPKELVRMIGRTVNQDIQEGQPTRWELFNL